MMILYLLVHHSLKLSSGLLQAVEPGAVQPKLGMKRR